jgi:hypothetical protein
MKYLKYEKLNDKKFSEKLVIEKTFLFFKYQQEWLLTIDNAWYLNKPTGLTFKFYYKSLYPSFFSKKLEDNLEKARFDCRCKTGTKTTN